MMKHKTFDALDLALLVLVCAFCMISLISLITKPTSSFGNGCMSMSSAADGCAHADSDGGP